MIGRRVLGLVARSARRARRGVRSLRSRAPHLVRVRLASRRRLARWRSRLAELRRLEPERPVIAIGLIEHLGDIVAAEPVARWLRTRHPDARIVWPVRAPYRPLVEALPEVDEAWEIGCISEWARIARRAGFDEIVDLHLEWRSCAVCQQLYERADGDRSVSVANYYRHGALLQAFTRAAGLPVMSEAPRIVIPDATRRRVDALALPARYVAVHGTSNQDARDWRRDRWVELVARLRASGTEVVEVGLAPLLPPSAGARSLCGALDVLESAEVIRRAALFIGVDSGPAHLANAVGTPGIILLGRYRSYDWYLPYTGGYATGERADVIHHDGPAADIAVDTVHALAAAWLDGRRAARGNGAVHVSGSPVPSGATATRLHPGRVSVVIPTYGHRELVRATLDSVFAQAHADLEIIVVNDGSPDDTADVLRPLVDAGRIRYVEQTNQGQGAARNRGLELASGEFVAFLDDDDLWPEGTIDRLVRALREHPDAVLAYGDHCRLGPDGRARAVPPEGWPSGDVRAAFRRRNWLLSPGQALIRTAAMRAVGGFDPRIWGSDDWDLYIRLAERGPFVHLDVPTLHYRVHAQNASRRAVLHARNHLKVVRRHIGWDLREVWVHQRLAARYFVPNLMQCARAARSDGHAGEAVAAHLYALLFDPALATRPWFVRSLTGSAFARPPRVAPG